MVYGTYNWPATQIVNVNGTQITIVVYGTQKTIVFMGTIATNITGQPHMIVIIKSSLKIAVSGNERKPEV